MKSQTSCSIALQGKIVILLLAILSMAASLAASEFHQNAVRQVHFEVDPATATVLSIVSTNGDITVTGAETDMVRVDAEIHVSGRRSEVCEEIASRVEKQVQRPERHGDKLVFDPDLPHKIGYGVSITYTVIMPVRLSVDLETSNGELVVATTTGGAVLESTNGSITAMDITGNLTASSVNGSIFLTKVVSSNVSAETINGQIECSCINKAPDKINISTVNGGIDVTLPKGANAALSVDTVNGGLFISTGRGEITSKNRGSIEMTIGNGSGRYEMSSVNGSVNVVVANPPD